MITLQSNTDFSAKECLDLSLVCLLLVAVERLQVGDLHPVGRGEVSQALGTPVDKNQGGSWVGIIKEKLSI